MRVTFLIPFCLAAAALTSCSGDPASVAVRRSASPTTPSPSARPTVSDAPAAAFSTCRAIAGTDLTSIGGVTWAPGAAATAVNALQCRVNLVSLPAGGSITLDYVSSGTPTLDVADRIRDLPSKSGKSKVVRLSKLAAGTSAGGVALVHGGSASFLLYASTKTAVISIACIPPTSVPSSTDMARLVSSATGLLRWAVAHQPINT